MKLFRRAKRTSWINCYVCRHDLNGDNESFLGELHNEWVYRCSNCGTVSVFDLRYPVPTRVVSRDEEEQKMSTEYRLYGAPPTMKTLCPDCSAVVGNEESHNAFHDKFDKLTDRFLAPKSEERNEKAKDDSLDSWVERITAAVRYTGTGDHEDVRSILHDFTNRSATDNSNPHPATAQARTVRTVEELDALPEKSVIRFGEQDAAAKDDLGVWWGTGDERDVRSESVPLPALVLWTPNEEEQK